MDRSSSPVALDSSVQYKGRVKRRQPALRRVTSDYEKRRQAGLLVSEIPENNDMRDLSSGVSRHTTEYLAFGQTLMARLAGLVQARNSNDAKLPGFADQGNERRVLGSEDRFDLGMAHPSSRAF